MNITELRRANLRQWIDERCGGRQALFAQTAAYGHFGRTDLDLPWEHTNRVQELRAAAGL